MRNMMLVAAALLAFVGTARSESAPTGAAPKSRAAVSPKPARHQPVRADALKQKAKAAAPAPKESPHSDGESAVIKAWRESDI